MTVLEWKECEMKYISEKLNVLLTIIIFKFYLIETSSYINEDILIIGSCT